MIGLTVLVLLVAMGLLMRTQHSWRRRHGRAPLTPAACHGRRLAGYGLLALALVLLGRRWPLDLALLLWVAGAGLAALVTVTGDSLWRLRQRS